MENGIYCVQTTVGDVGFLSVICIWLESESIVLLMSLCVFEGLSRGFDKFLESFPSQVRS